MTLEELRKFNKSNTGLFAGIRRRREGIYLPSELRRAKPEDVKAIIVPYLDTATIDKIYPNLTVIDGGCKILSGISVPELQEATGSCSLFEDTSAPKLKGVGGPCYIHRNANVQALEFVDGDCLIDNNSNVNSLVRIGGHCSFMGKVTAPKLVSIDGNCTFTENTSAPELEHIGGDTVIDKGTEVPKLKVVGGDIELEEGSSAPSLVRVNGDCVIREKAKADKLKIVDGDCEIERGGSAHSLKTVRGDCEIHSKTNVSSLKTVGGNCIAHKGAIAPRLREVREEIEVFQGGLIPSLETAGSCILHADVVAPSLRKTTWGCILSDGASAPELKEAEGDIFIHNASLPSLVKVKGVCVIYDKAKVPALKEVDGDCNIIGRPSLPSLVKVSGGLNVRMKASGYTCYQMYSSGAAERNIPLYYDSILNGTQVDRRVAEMVQEAVRSYQSTPKIVKIKLRETNKDIADKVEALVELNSNPELLKELRVKKQQEMITDECRAYADNLDTCDIAYPGADDKIWKYPPYIVTDVQFSTLPYADGKPLSECPGWQNGQQGFGKIKSITVWDGNGNSKTFSGNEIDDNNNLTFVQEDMVIKYGIQTGKVAFIPMTKKEDENMDQELTMTEHIGLKL